MKKDIRYIPFPQFCHKCKYRMPIETFTSFNEPDTVYEIGCENKEICVNAINQSLDVKGIKWESNK